MTYNMTELAASTTASSLFIYANNSTGGVLVTLFVLSIFFIMILYLKKYDFDNALLVSSWICFIISMIFSYIKMIALIWVLLYLIIGAFTAFYMFMFRGQG